MLELFLSPTDQGRCERVLEKLTTHDIQSCILTGGLATEIQLIRRGASPTRRSLNDIDFVTESFESLPKHLQRDFLFRHVHPLDPPGKTILQAVDVEEAIRVDVFRDGGVASSRAEKIHVSGLEISIISFEDLLARTARLSLDIVQGEVPAKHARDFLRLFALSNGEAVENAWQFHRREDHPTTFREASHLLHALIPRRHEYLVSPKYSSNGKEVCNRCRSTPHFPLADPMTIYSILGYY